MPLINCEINLVLIWSADCLIALNTVANQKAKFAKIYVAIVTLSTDDKEKLLEKIKSDFKRTIHWNKLQSK